MTVARALARGKGELVALCLLQGALNALALLPRGTAPSMVEVLSNGEGWPKGRKRSQRAGSSTPGR